jgi:hypothetical protein
LGRRRRHAVRPAPGLHRDRQALARAAACRLRRPVLPGARGYAYNAGRPRLPFRHRRPVEAGAVVVVHQNGKATSVGVNSRLVATYNEVGLAAAVAGLGLVSMTAGAARKEVAQGLLVRVLEDWDMGEIELYAVFPRRQGGEAGRARPHRLPDRGVCEGPRADAEAAAQPLGRLLGLEPPRSRRTDWTRGHRFRTSRAAVFHRLGGTAAKRQAHTVRSHAGLAGRSP